MRVSVQNNSSRDFEKSLCSFILCSTSSYLFFSFIWCLIFCKRMYHSLLSDIMSVQSKYSTFHHMPLSYSIVKIILVSCDNGTMACSSGWHISLINLMEWLTAISHQPSQVSQNVNTLLTTESSQFVDRMTKNVLSNCYSFGLSDKVYQVKCEPQIVTNK